MSCAGWSESSVTVFRPVFPQLCVHVVIDPRDEGKHSDSHSSADPHRADRTPAGHTHEDSLQKPDQSNKGKEHC